MARKYEYQPNRFGLAMEACEERVIIALFTDVEGRAVGQEWTHQFRHFFYNSGVGVAITYINAINAVRRRGGRDEVHFAETIPGDYCMMNDRTIKAKLRQTWVTEYRGLDTADRVLWYHKALDETAALPPSFAPSLEERIADRAQFNGNVLSAREIAMRAAAVTRQKLKPMLDAKAKAIQQLGLLVQLGNDDLMARAVSMLNPDLALEISHQFDDPKLQTMLVARSFEFDPAAYVGAAD
jgi:hypothetical protein